MSHLGSLLGSRQFLAGLTVGVVVTLVVALGAAVVAAGRRRRVVRAPDSDAPRRVLAPTGAAFVVATLVAVAWLGPVDGGAEVTVSVVAGLALLWAAGALADRAPQHRGLLGAAFALPGGLLLAADTTSAPVWTAALLLVGPALAGTATADVDARLGDRGAAVIGFAIALCGLYVTVPDTELPRAAVGAAVPLVLLAWPVPLGRLGRGGSYAATGLLLWMAVVSGSGRWGSAVGAAAGLGLLLAEPVGRALAGAGGRTVVPDLIARPVALFVGQLAMTLFCTRVAGFQDTASRSFVLCLLAGGVAVAVTTAAARSAARSAAHQRRRAAMLPLIQSGIPPAMPATQRPPPPRASSPRTPPARARRRSRRGR
jgi:hypothetical protein